MKSNIPFSARLVFLLLPIILIAFTIFYIQPALAAPDIDNDNGVWVDSFTDSAGVFTSYSNGVAHNPSAGLMELSGATNGYFTTVKIEPPGFDAWKVMEIDANRAVQSQVRYEVYYDDQGALPPLGNPPAVLSGILPIDGRVDLSSLDASRGAIRVRVILDGTSPIPKPTIKEVKVTWNPRSIVLLDKLGPETVVVGNNIRYEIRYSVSYVEAKSLVVYDTLPTVGGTDANVVYPGDYGQNDAPYFDADRNRISNGGQYTAGGTTVNGVIIPPNSIYWDLGDVAAGTAGTLQFGLSTRNGDLGRHSDETGTIVNNLAFGRASNADDTQSNIFTTEYIASPKPNLLKTPGNNIGSINGVPTALAGTTVEYIFRSPLGPTDNNDWAQKGRETMYESVLYDDVSDFAGKIDTAYGTSGFNITGGGVYSPTFIAPDGSGPFPAVVWDIGTLTPGQNFDRRFTVQPICPAGNPTSITNIAYLDSARTDPVSSQFELNVICQGEPGWAHYKGDELNGQRGVTGVKDFDDDTYLPGRNTNWVTYGDDLEYLLTLGNSGFTDNHDGFLFDRIQPISTTLSSVDPLPAGFNGKIYYSTDPTFTDELTPPDYDNTAPLADIDVGGNDYWQEFDPLNPPADIDQATWLAWYVEELATGMLDSSIITDSLVVSFDVTVEPIDNTYACQPRTYTNTSSAAMWAYDNGSAIVDFGSPPPVTQTDTEITYIRPEVGVFELDSSITPDDLPIPGTATYTLKVKNLNVSGSDTFTDTYVDLNWSDISVFGTPEYPGFISIDGGTVNFSNPAEFDPANGYIRVYLGPMVPGESRTITLDLQLPGGSINLENYSVNAAATGIDNICDPVKATNNATANVINGPKLEIIKNDVLNIIQAGSEVTYTLNYRNVGTGASLNTIVGDRVPENMVFVEGSEPAGTTFYVSTDTALPPVELASDPLSYDLVTAQFTPAPGGVCPFADTADCERVTWVAWLVDDPTAVPSQLPSDGVFRQVSFKTRNDEDSTAAQVDSLAGTLIFNTSGIFADNSLPAISNETVTTISDIPSLDLEKSAQSEISSGETLDYVITYRNASEADNPIVWITDTLPAGAVYVSTAHSWNAKALANGAPADNNSAPIPTNLVSNVDGTTDIGLLINSYRNGDLLSEEGGVITITVEVDPTAFKSGDLLINSVCGQAFNAVNDVSYVCDDAVTEVLNADLQIIKQVDETEPPAGSTVTWLLNISNEGRNEATNTVIRDTLPPNVTYVAGSATILTPGYEFMDTGNNTTAINPVVSGSPATGQVLEFSTARGNAIGQSGEADGTFPGTSGSVYLSFQTQLDAGIAPGTTMTNTATVSTDSVEDVSDPCPVTQCPNEDTATITTPLPDPSVIKTGPTLADPGSGIEWTLSYRNQNNEVATNVYLIDTLPDHNGDDVTDLQFLSTDGTSPAGVIPATDIYYSAAATAPAFDPSGPSGGWTNDVSTLGTQPRHIAYVIGTLEARSTVYEITIRGILNDPATGDPLAAGLTLDNDVTIFADVDDDPSNNTDTASTETPGLEMAITKIGDPEGIYPGTVPGGQIAYTLAIENKGTTVAYGVKISDTLPAEVSANTPFDNVTLLKLTDADGNTVYPVDTSGTDITTDITVERVDNGSEYIWYLGLAPGNQAAATYYRKIGIPPGARMSFDIYVTIDGDTPDQTTITNPAEVTVDRQNDGNPAEKFLANNTDTSFVNVYRADLTTDKTVVDVATGSETQTSAGSVLSYTVTYNNLGNTAAENAILTDNLPNNTCLVLGSIENPTGTTIEYSNNDGTTWDYSPTADANGADCSVTDYRLVFGNAIPAPANSYGEAPANLNLPSGQLLWLDGSDNSTVNQFCGPEEHTPVMWIDASNIISSTLNGNAFEQIDDLSNNLNHAHQTDVTEQPAVSTINGRRAAQFDGSDSIFNIDNDDLINTTDVASTTLYIVFETGNDVASRQVIYEEGGATNNINIYLDGGNLYGLVRDGDWGAPIFISAPVETNTAYQANIMYDGTSPTFTMHVNGALIGSDTPGALLSAHTGDIGLGGSRQDMWFHDGDDTTDPDAFHFSGKIGEFMRYNDSHGDSERQEVESYLAYRWGLDGVLPAAHPYKSTQATCSAVREWEDKSGNNHHFTQLVDAKQPISQNDGINFDGTDDFLEFAELPNPEDLTVFVIASSDVTPFNDTAWHFSGRGPNGLVTTHPNQGTTTSNSYIADSSGTFQLIGSDTISNITSKHIFATRFDDTSNAYTRYLDGLLTQTATPNIERTAETTSLYYVGADTYNSARFGDGTVYEIIVYDRALTDTEIDQASRYLSVKWDIPYTGGDNVVFDGTLLDSVCGNGTASSPFVDVACLQGVPTGTYWFNIEGISFQGYVDGETDGGGWLMVLNYLHEGNTSPATVPMGASLPLLGSNALGTDESGTIHWGHANNALMTALNIDEMRFYGETSAHNRILHFSTRSAASIEYAETGTGNMTDIINSYTTYSDHSAFLPAQMNNVAIDNQGDYALTVEPYRNTGDYHWNVNRGGRWEVDDYPNNDDNDTFHRIFVRKDSLDITVPTADHLVCLAPLPNVSCEDGTICAPFDEGAGTTSVDISGNDNDFTLFNTPWVDNNDQRGTYLDFSADGTSDYAILENFDMPTDSMTVAFWVASDYTSYQEVIVSYAVPGTDNELMFMWENGNGFKIYASGPSVTTGVDINDSGWHHVAFSRESASGSTQLFIDGSRVYSGTLQAGVALETGGTLVLAQDQDNVGGGFASSQELEGYMDDFRLYDRVLTEAEITALADGSANTTERFKSSGTYTTTITADPTIGGWDKLILGQELPDGSDIEYEIFDASGTTSLIGPSNAPAGYLDISAIDPSNVNLTLVARLMSDNSGQTCLNEWQATYSSSEDPSFTFQARVDEAPVDPSLIHNEVSISTTTPESDDTNNDGFDDIAVETVNLVVEKLVDPSAVLTGEAITYTIDFENEGPGTAANVTLTDTLPVSVTHVSTTPSVGICALPVGQDIVCDLGDIGPKASGTITVVATADLSAANQIIFNGVAISSDTNEITLNDNSDSVPTFVGNIANLAISKIGPRAFSSSEGSAIELGELITYTLVYENNGTGDAPNTIITDTLPAGTTYAGYNATPAAICTHNSGIFECTLNTLASGAMGTIDLGVTVDNDPNLVGTVLENVAIITTSDPETTLSDNSDTFENPVDLKPASLSGYVWFDNDQDVNRELSSGEGPIAGVEIQLTGLDIFGNSVVMTTTTDSTGFYAFSNLNPSDATGYTLTEVQPSGYQSTGSDIGQISGAADTNATNPSSDEITGILLSSGEQGQHYNFGEVAPVTIGDIVWNDYNGNGQQDDGEAVLQGITVTLYYNGTPISTTVTGLDGTYLFTNDGTDPLFDGNYFVEFTAPATYTFTIPNASGVNDVVDSDADPDTGRTQTFTADLGDNIPTLDAGLLIPASIGDTVWLDLDGDGVEDAGEPGIPGVVITATAGSGLVLTTTTDSDGFYEFTGLGADTFTITVDANTLPAGITQTGDPGGSSSLDNSHTETLNPGDDIDTVDFGYQGSGSIGDTVWLDLNGDGVEDSGEGGIGGVVITLTAASGYEITTTTTITGYYQFENLPADDYTIQVDTNTLPEGVTQTGDPGGLGSLDHTHAVTLGAGQSIQTVDFGYIGDSALGDYVWQDLNGDGVQDTGEPAIPGVVITLTQPSGAVVTATTTITGFYQFTGLAAGTYQVDVDTDSPNLNGLTQTGDPGGSGSLDNQHTQVLGANQTIDTVDFGYRAGGSLGDTIWVDLNNDGIEDPGEPGIPGVVVSMTLPSGVVITTTTTTNGFYQFTGLGPGNHTVEVDTNTLPPALTQSGDPDSTLDHSHTYPLSLNEAATTVDFGYAGSGYIGDTVWVDLNGDGIEDPSEPGIPGVVITLTTSTGAYITTTTTITGFYEFPALPADTYTVTVDANTLPADYSQSGDPDSTIDHTHTLSITTGERVETVDFGYLTAAELGNVVWHDLNGNGLQEIGEPGIGGITVTLTLSGTGLITTTQTDASGFYTFTNLLPGEYQVTFDPPPNYTLTDQDAGGDDAVDSDADPSTGTTTWITLQSGDSDMTWDAGVYEPVSLGDYVWSDEDPNGLLDFGEPGIPDVTVTLILSGTGAITTTTTDSNGFYEFTDLPPGTYAVEFTQPDDFYPTLNDEGADDTIDSDMSPTTLRTEFVTLESGDVDNTLDAGFYPGGSLGDVVWEDLNGNGIQDPGEPTVPGVTVTLILSGTGQISTTVTGPDGTYLFDGLEADTYTVAFTPPAGTKIIEKTDAGSNDTVDSDANPITGQSAPISLGRNEHNPTIDAGLYRPVSLGDTVWADENGNGIQDPGEVGFPGVTVSLIVSGTGVITSTTTDINGYYDFTDLPPGDYIVQFNLPTDYIVSPFERGGDDSVDSNTLFLGNQTAPITLASGENDPTIDVGLYHPLQLGNLVWYDLNDNGVQDIGESGIEGVTLRLLDGNGDPVLDPTSSGAGVPYTTTTDLNGLYVFDYLAPGDYIVEIMTENFEAWDAPLYSYLNSLSTQGVDPADPDNDANTDDNGQNSLDPVETEGVAAYVVTLGFGSEPMNDGGGVTPPDSNGNQALLSYTYPDTSTNLTVDFGFFEMLTLGNRIWNDQNGDGVQDINENGMPAGIVLQLLDGNGNPIVNPETGQPVTTTTQANGLYQFGNLAPGDYVVFIQPENFQAGGPLEGYTGSNGSSDPDDDSDVDDNGEDEIYPTISGILSQPITLDYQTEPDNFSDGDNNANTNFTVDFGLVAVPTAVELLKFEAKVVGTLEVRLAWATATEVDNFGFRIMRSGTGRFEDAEQVHFEASTVTTGTGSTYAYWDTVPTLGAYTYWLIDVETTGLETAHLPVTVEIGSNLDPVLPYQIFLPGVKSGD